jgi:crotonobetainyl-CoA:carnitine CoA-transferase CaiB-like acyl-CoA transferase
VEEEHPRAGHFRTLDTAVRFAKTPGARRGGAPALGEHTDEVLREAGLSADHVARLRAAGVVR